MKKLDAYVARAYILRFLLAHLVIMGLYMSFDIMQRIDMFHEAGAGRTISQLLVFYMYQIPSNLVDTVPPLLMLSAGLVFVHMNRNGELLTLKACGISLRRISLPILIVTLPVIALLGWAQERLIPDIYRQHSLLENKMQGRVSGPFLLYDGRYGYELYVMDYDFQREVMNRPVLVQSHPDSAIPRQILEADSATWSDDNNLLFTGARIKNYDPRGRPAGEEESPETTEWPTSLTITHFVDAQHGELATRAPAMTLSDLRKRIRENPHNPRFKVLFHTRISDKLTPLVLLLIGIPILVGYGANHQSRLVGALIAMLVMAIYYVLNFIALSVGNAGAVAPALSAWLMPSVGLIAGTIIFFNMRT